MPMMSYLSMKHFELTEWQGWVLLSVVIISVIILIVGLIKTR